MKKGQLIGIGIASLGVIACVGSAVALYTKAANEVQFGFGKFNYTPSTDSLNYYLGTIVEENDVVGDSTITKKYKIPMSALYPTNENTKVISQSYRAGNISVEFSSTNAVFQNKTTVSAAVKGYATTSYLKDGVTVLNNVAYGTETVSGAADVTVETGDTSPTIEEGAQYLEVSLVFNGTYLTFNEAGFNLKVTWDKHSTSYKPAFIKGDANEWGAVEEFEMVENIGGTEKEWMFTNFTGFEVMKIWQDDGTENGKWVGGNGGADVAVDKDTTYDVYWKESKTTIATNQDEHGKWYIS